MTPQLRAWAVARSAGLTKPLSRWCLDPWISWGTWAGARSRPGGHTTGQHTTSQEAQLTCRCEPLALLTEQKLPGDSQAAWFLRGRRSSHFSRNPLLTVPALPRTSQEDFYGFELLFWKTYCRIVTLIPSGFDSSLHPDPISSSQHLLFLSFLATGASPSITIWELTKDLTYLCKIPYTKGLT